jgi:phage gpG-like protein
MPPRARSSGSGLTQGLRIDQDILAFEFTPTIGILARDIDKLGVDIRSFREPLERAVKEVMIPSIQKNFERGGRPAWAPLSEVTLEIRAREGSGSRKLIRSGNLKKNMSYMTMWDINGERAIIKDLPDRVWYGKIHQAGYGSMSSRISSQVSRAARGGQRISADEASRRAISDLDKALRSGQRQRSAATIPARPFVMIHPEDEDDIRQVFDEWFEERMRGVGLL